MFTERAARRRKTDTISHYAAHLALLAAPGGFVVNAKELQVNAGADFILVLTYDIMTMSGLRGYPRRKFDFDEINVTSGLF